MSRPPRLALAEYLGLRQYFLTVCTHQRQRHFESPAVVNLVRLHFLHACRHFEFELSAYCFMPDHMHALVTANEESAELTRMMRLAKQRSAFYFKELTGRRLWQEGYFDRVLRGDVGMPNVISYVVGNPVRAGLVESPGDYPHWGAEGFTRDEVLEFVATFAPKWA